MAVTEKLQILRYYRSYGTTDLMILQILRYYRSMVKLPLGFTSTSTETQKCTKIQHSMVTLGTCIGSRVFVHLEFGRQFTFFICFLGG